MTDQSDILSNEAQVTEPVTQDVVETQTSDTTAKEVDVNSLFKDQLSAIRHEETGLQKYASVEDALKGTAFAQDHLRTLEGENAELRNRLEALAQTAITNEPQQTAKDGVSSEDVYKLMRNYEASKVKESNRSSVRDTLLDHCKGDVAKADEFLNTRAKELNISRAQLADLAAESPTAATNLLGLVAKGTSSNYMEPSISSDAVDVHIKKELPTAKPLPIGADSSHLLSAWRDAVAEVNNNI